MNFSKIFGNVKNYFNHIVPNLTDRKEYEYMVYIHSTEGYECWKLYDQMDQLIYLFDNHGNEAFKEYNQNGFLVRELHYNNYEEDWYAKYNENGQIIYKMNPTNIYEKWEYNRQNQLIHYENSGNGYNEYWKYDQKGREIYHKKAEREETKISYNDKDKTARSHYKINGNNIVSHYKFNHLGKLIHLKNSQGEENWYEYDEAGNEIYYKSSSGYERWTTFNKGKIINRKDNRGYEEWSKYDDKGRLLYSKNTNGFEYKVIFSNNGYSTNIENPTEEFEYYFEFINRSEFLQSNIKIQETFDQDGKLLNRKIGDNYEEFFQYIKNEKEKDNTNRKNRWETSLISAMLSNTMNNILKSKFVLSFDCMDTNESFIINHQGKYKYNNNGNMIDKVPIPGIGMLERGQLAGIIKVLILKGFFRIKPDEKQANSKWSYSTLKFIHGKYGHELPCNQDVINIWKTIKKIIFAR